MSSLAGRRTELGSLRWRPHTNSSDGAFPRTGRPGTTVALGQCDRVTRGHPDHTDQNRITSKGAGLVRAWQLTFVLVACGLGITLLTLNNRSNEMPQTLGAIEVPICPGAEKVTDELHSDSRRIEYHVALHYPSMEVLQYYNKRLPQGGDWVPAKSPLARVAGEWLEGPSIEHERVDGMYKPTGRHQGTARDYQYVWSGCGSDLLLWLIVRDYALLDDAVRPAWARGANPDQHVTIILVPKSSVDAAFRTDVGSVN